MRTAVSWLLTIATAIVLVLAFEAEVAKPFRVPTASMEPTLHCARPESGCKARFSDRVIACEICYRFATPHRGQIVVFHAPPTACGTGGVFVKRIVGLPGETVHEDGRGLIWIDGRLLRERYIPAVARATDGNRNETWRVPQGSYFMMGDNRGDSCDSRTWGPVRRSSLIGPVVMRYWPPDRLSL
jgi:signal peptidase I